jgi:hypothetical protein
VPRRRLQLFVIIALALLVFLAISVGLARIFNADSSVRGAVTDLVKAEARGDHAAMVAQITGCAADPACRARAAADAQALKRAGTVSVLEINTGIGSGLGGATGTARIAWEIVDSTRPIVQCVRVRRAGNVLSGFHIELLKISTRIKSNADCPKNY